MSVGKLLRNGLPFSNVVANGVATASILPGRTIEGIELTLGGTFTYAHITLVRIKANGKTFYEASGTQIDKINKFQGLTYPATMLPILFTEIVGRDLVDQMMGAFDTSNGIANITIEVTIAGATSPTLTMSLIESAPQASSVSPIMKKVLRYPWSVAAGGQLPIMLPFGPVNGAVIQRIHIEHGVANNVTACVIKENGVVVHESTKAVNDAHNQMYRGVNQANWYSVDMVVDENVKNAMDTRTDKSLELIPTFGAADSGFVIVEYLDTLGNL
jgi:hypothetical protein